MLRPYDKTYFAILLTEKLVMIMYKKGENLMNIILIRHGDPDYVNDTLTAKGHEEANKLCKFLSGTPIDALYQSPNGTNLTDSDNSPSSVSG